MLHRGTYTTPREECVDGKWRGRIGQEVLYVGIIEEEGKGERERERKD